MKIYQNHANTVDHFPSQLFAPLYHLLTQVYESCKMQKWHLNQGTCLFVEHKPWCLYADSTMVHQKWTLPLFAGLCCIVYIAMNHKALSRYVLRCLRHQGCKERESCGGWNIISQPEVCSAYPCSSAPAAGSLLKALRQWGWALGGTLSPSQSHTPPAVVLNDSHLHHLPCLLQV